MATIAERVKKIIVDKLGVEEWINAESNLLLVDAIGKTNWWC